MADTVGESTPPSAGAGAQKREARDTLLRRRLNSARAAGRGRVLESMSWSGRCSSACVQCLGLTGACAACSHCTATAW